MSVWLGVLGVVVFVVVLTFSVAWHELGHLIPAKAFGVQVSQYFIGFGPTVFSRKYRGTEYGLKALPLGGFIRMAGMYSPANPNRRPRFRWQASLEEEVRQFSAQEVAEAGVEHSFYRLSAPRKIVVMLGGPTMNLILAAVLTAIVVGGIGTYSQPSLTLAAVSPCLVSSDDADGCASDAALPGPAAEAGFQPGDTVRSVDGAAVETWEQFSVAIQTAGGAPVRVGVDRDGQALDLTVTPVMATGVSDQGEEVQRALIGVTSATARVRGSVTEVPGILWQQIRGAAASYARLPVAVWETARDTAQGKERDPEGSPVSIVGIARLQGEITADSAALDTSDAWAMRWASWLSIGAMLNLALWLFNLLPLLPLDGGHIAGAVIEGVRRTWARLRHRPRTGPIDLARAIPLTYGVVGLILLMTVVLVWADFANPIQI
jgi:membrane-associated protease RseP (regulator of RpoE activity)